MTRRPSRSSRRRTGTPPPPCSRDSGLAPRHAQFDPGGPLARTGRNAPQPARRVDGRPARTAAGAGQRGPHRQHRRTWRRDRADLRSDGAQPSAVIGLSLPPEILRPPVTPRIRPTPSRCVCSSSAGPRPARGSMRSLARSPSSVPNRRGASCPRSSRSRRSVAGRSPGRPARGRETVVHARGRIDAAALAEAYAEAHAVVAPSRYESFGLVYQEAMAYGRPVIACAEDASARAFVGLPGAGPLAEASTGAALADALRPLLKDPACRLAYRARALAAAGRFEPGEPRAGDPVALPPSDRGLGLSPGEGAEQSRLFVQPTTTGVERFVAEGARPDVGGTEGMGNSPMQGDEAAGPSALQDRPLMDQPCIADRPAVQPVLHIREHIREHAIDPVRTARVRPTPHHRPRPTRRGPEATARRQGEESRRHRAGASTHAGRDPATRFAGQRNPRPGAGMPRTRTQPESRSPERLAARSLARRGGSRRRPSSPPVPAARPARHPVPPRGRSDPAKTGRLSDSSRAKRLARAARGSWGCRAPLPRLIEGACPEGEARRGDPQGVEVETIGSFCIGLEDGRREARIELCAACGRVRIVADQDPA